MRSLWWWLRSGLYGLLIVATVMVAAPTFAQRGSLPRFLAHHQMNLSFDIVGGIRLVYQVDAEAVVARRLESLAPVLQQRIRDAFGAPAATVTPGPDQTLVVTIDHARDDRARFRQLADTFGLDEVARGPGGPVFRLPGNQIAELVDRSTQTATDTIDARTGPPWGF